MEELDLGLIQGQVYMQKSFLLIVVNQIGRNLRDGQIS